MTNTCITTISNLRFDYSDIKNSEISITDIATALSRIYRFLGHSDQLISVARHSINVAEILRRQGYDCNTVMAGLLHDGSEAYMADLPSPLKPLLPDYRRLEDRVQERIYQRFSVKINERVWKAVREADRTALENEQAEYRDLPPLLVGTLPLFVFGPNTDRDEFITQFFTLQDIREKKEEAVASGR